MFHIESSPSLQNDTWTDVTTAFDALPELEHEDGTATVTFRAQQSLGAGPQFYRVRLSRE